MIEDDVFVILLKKYSINNLKTIYETNILLSGRNINQRLIMKEENWFFQLIRIDILKVKFETFIFNHFNYFLNNTNIFEIKHEMSYWRKNVKWSKSHFLTQERKINTIWCFWVEKGFERISPKIRLFTLLACSWWPPAQPTNFLVAKILSVTCSGAL